jgi:hypothetical protein
MDNKEYPKVRKAAIRQGWRPKPTKDGEMLLSPDGVTKAHWHKTPSDHRALDNFMRDLRKGGFKWPPPKR